MKLLGLVLIIAGAGLAFWGFQASGSFGSQLSEAFTGTPSDRAMMFYIAGALSLVVGLFLFIKR